jgi:hypothetical protein
LAIILRVHVEDYFQLTDENERSREDWAATELAACETRKSDSTQESVESEQFEKRKCRSCDRQAAPLAQKNP